MNIFMLSSFPWAAARFHHDKHVIKMALETAQILSAVCHLSGKVPKKKLKKLYGLSHANHPCVIWAGKRYANARYLWQLAHALDHEKQRRWKSGPHKATKISQLAFEYLYEYVWPANKPRHNLMSRPAQAMPEEYRSASVIESYRAYYCNEKMKMGPKRRGRRTRSRWTNRREPFWLAHYGVES